MGKSLPLLGYLLSRIEYGQVSQDLTEAPFFLTLPLHRLIALACTAQYRCSCTPFFVFFFFILYFILST